MSDDLLQSLEAKMDRLIAECERLADENRQLRAERASWDEERERLIEKNQLACTRVEAMIERLKNLELDG